jgi:uncharacterized protein YkwD
VTTTAPRARRRLPVLLVALLVLAATAVGVAPAAGAAVDPAAAEARFLTRLNEERAAAGLAPVVADPALEPIAREWSGAMRASRRLEHRGDLAAQLRARVPGWQRFAENVGRGEDVEGLHAAFMGSPSHRENVLGPYNRVGIGVAVDGATTWVTVNLIQGPAIDGPTGLAPPAGDLWVATAAGDIRAFGSARALGSLSGIPLARPVVGMAATRSGGGYWLVASDGGIFSFGDAAFHGSTGGLPLNQPIVGMAATPSGGGYWLVASDGGIFSFGDAAFHGSTGGLPLARPIVGMAATPAGHGYWMVAADGGVFTFGSAPFLGSAAGATGGSPVRGMAATPSGRGYRIVAADGRVVAFGDAGAGVSGPLVAGQAVVSLTTP